MDFEKMIVYLTFIPWLLYFFKNATNILKELKGATDIGYRKWFARNFYKVLRADTLLLLALFFYFARYNTSIVNKLLFTVIHLYMWVNTFYEKKEYKAKIEKSDIPTYILLAIFASVPIIMFELSLTQVEAYKLMCIVTFVTFFLVLIAKVVTHPYIKKRKIIKKKKN